jgi:hypothetical protein
MVESQLPQTDYVNTAMLIKRKPYIIAPQLKRAPDCASTIVYYLAYRNEPGLLGPTGWNEYVIGPGAIEAFLNNLDAHAAGGAAAYMFGPPAPNVVESARFVEQVMAGKFGEAAQSYGRALAESVKGPGWWVQMLTAAASAAKPPAPGGVAPKAPPVRPAPPALRVLPGGGAKAGTTAVVGRTSATVYATEGSAARAVQPSVEFSPAPKPPPLQSVPPPAASPAPVTAGQPVLIPPYVISAVISVMAASARTRRPQVSPYTAPRVGPQPESSEESNKRGCESGVGEQLGGHSCHDTYAMSISGVSREFTLRTPEGVTVSFDALGPDGVLYEVKTGHRALVFNQNLPNRQTRINRMIDQSMQQAGVAQRCGYPLVWIFNDQAARDFFDGVVLPRTAFQPFDCNEETD